MIWWSMQSYSGILFHKQDDHSFRTKALQSRLFQEYRSMPLNNVPQTTLIILDPRSVLIKTSKYNNDIDTTIGVVKVG